MEDDNPGNIYHADFFLDRIFSLAEPIFIMHALCKDTWQARRLRKKACNNDFNITSHRNDTIERERERENLMAAGGRELCMHYFTSSLVVDDF